MYFSCSYVCARNLKTTKIMKEVTKEEYLKAFMNIDSICNVDSSKGYPYMVYWTLRNRPNDIIAKKVPINKKNEYQYLIK